MEGLWDLDVKNNEEEKYSTYHVHVLRNVNITVKQPLPPRTLRLGSISHGANPLPRC